MDHERLRFRLLRWTGLAPVMVTMAWTVACGGGDGTGGSHSTATGSTTASGTGGSQSTTTESTTAGGAGGGQTTTTTTTTGSDTGSTTGSTTGSSTASGCTTGTPCGGTCVDLSSDPANCGACGTSVPTGGSCVNGVPTCPGQMGAPCGGVCKDLATDLANCGACGVVVAGGSCVNGVPACPGQLGAACGGVCTDLATDQQNCGACGVAVTPGGYCANGQSQCPGQMGAVCGGVCTDLATDAQNCGGCGVVVTGGSCKGGAPCPTRCTADLHQVVDCDNTLLFNCPDTQACVPGGTCQDPCTAAAANQSTFGCDFYSLPPSTESETTGSCFAALIANTWKTPISVQVEYQGQQLDVGNLLRVPVGSGAGIGYQAPAGGQLAPGEIGILFLSQGPGGDVYFVPCPAGITPGLQSDPATMSTAVVSAFHITTSAPIVAYDIYPYGGAASFVSSATLLVPTPAWGTNYVATDAYPVDPNLVYYGGQPFVQIVASTDNTNVTINPTAPIVGGSGVPGTGQGQPVSYTLNRGQAVQLLQSAELAGSPITADHPVGVWGGSGCMNIPVGVFACDSGHQQLLPVGALGHEYAAVRYRDRDPGSNESVPWTLIGAVDGTALTYDPAPPAGAPTTLATGQVVRFSASNAFTVKSQDDQHPFYVAGHMTGGQYASGYQGDPEYVNVVPPQQFLPYYLFLTDPTYSNTNLVFVRQKAPDGTFKDVTLDCAGTLSGWQPIGYGGVYEFTRLDLTVSGSPQGACDNGVHTAQSEIPFGLTVWGWDVTVSYAYPAGMSTQKINQVVVPTN